MERLTYYYMKGSENDGWYLKPGVSREKANARLAYYEDLEEQREQGCKYCREYESIVEENGDFISFDATISKGVFLEACTSDVVLEAKVQFCPMCGRKLPEV